MTEIDSELRNSILNEIRNTEIGQIMIENFGDAEELADIQLEVKNKIIECDFYSEALKYCIKRYKETGNGAYLIFYGYYVGYDKGEANTIRRIFEEVNKMERGNYE